MIDYIGTFFLTGIGLLITENLIHRYAHNPLSGVLYRWHKVHHVVYPPSRPLSKKYINKTGKNVFVQYYLIGLGYMCLILPLRLFIISGTLTLCYGYLMNRLHEEMHTLGSPLERFKWFLVLRENHIQHHIDDSKLYSISVPR
mgnify:CR=1 FL=1|jgi:hypothetical protein